MKTRISSCLLILLMPLLALSSTEISLNELGSYYPKRQYQGGDIPLFAEHKDQLPQPIFDQKPSYIDFYYKAWEIGFQHFKAPIKSSPLVSNYIDEAFNENIFLWDMSFSIMWGNYAHHIFPAIEGLDNFYRTQLPDGEIIREIGEKDAKLGVKGWSEPGTPGNLNHPILAWAELEAYAFTADKERLSQVYLPLKKFRDSYQKIYHKDSGLYLTDHGAMDDSPRNSMLLAGIDVAAEMVIFDRWLASIAQILDQTNEVQFYTQRADHYANFINRTLWDEKTGFYYDWGKDNKRMTMRTIAAFWTLLGEIPQQHQVDRLVQHLNDPNSFNTAHRVPTHPVNEIGFNGDYWAGAVWVPTNTMIIEGLEKNQRWQLARDIALNHLDATTAVFEQTGTAWENYYPLKWQKGRKAKPDFIGWSGLAPINYLIKHKIGLRVDAPNNRVTWRINETSRHGLRGLRFKSPSGQWNSVDLIANKRQSLEQPIVITSECRQDFVLQIITNDQSREYPIKCENKSTIVHTLVN